MIDDYITESDVLRKIVRGSVQYSRVFVRVEECDHLSNPLIA